MDNSTKASTASKALSDQAEATNNEPRKLTASENFILTVKVLTGAAFLLALLWGLDRLV